MVSYGGGIFIVGGAANGNPHNPSALLYYDVANNKWHKDYDAPSGIKGSSEVSGIIGNKLYVQHEYGTWSGTIKPPN